MEILSAPRGAGKTTKLVYELLDKPASAIVVSTQRRKESMRVIVQMVLQRKEPTAWAEMNEEQRNIATALVMERVIPCADFQRGRMAGIEKLTYVMVDDLEDVLQYFLGGHVAVATVSVR